MELDLDNVVLKKIVFDHAEHAKDKKLNIAYGVDRNFLLGSGISMTSVLINNPDIDINFYIVTDYIDEDYIARVERLAEKFSTSITLLLFNNEAFRHLPSTKAWTYAMYYRYFAFEYLSTDLDTVLYLDADVICKGSLHAFSEIRFDGEYAAVVHDIDDVRFKSGERLGIPELTAGYFNSGVVFANLSVWKGQGLLSKAFNILSGKEPELLYFDQDVLNILFVGNVILLPRDFNYIYGVDWALPNGTPHVYKEGITDKTVLIHYVGVTKPWHSWATYPVTRFFLAAYEQSTWAERPLLDANTAKLYKRKSRHQKTQGKYISAVLSHILYIKSKLCHSLSYNFKKKIQIGKK